MSSTKPHRFGPPQPEQHSVLMNVGDGGFTDFEVFRGSWDVAQGVWFVLEGQRLGELVSYPHGPQVRNFCVRSVDDPRTKAAVRGDSYHALGTGSRALFSCVEQLAKRAEREYTRKRLGEITLAAVKDESLPTLGRVIWQVKEQVNLVGLKVARHDVEQAVKDRVTLGRVSTGDRYRDKGRGYFIRKKDGPLHKVKVNGQRLNQSSMAFHGDFYRLIKQDDGEFVPTTDKVVA